MSYSIFFSIEFSIHLRIRKNQEEGNKGTKGSNKKYGNGWGKFVRTENKEMEIKKNDRK